MRFHIYMEVRDTGVLDDDKRMREVLGPHLQRLLESDKVLESGLLSGKRGAFFIVDVDAPEEVHELLGPEISANFKTDVQPVAPLDFDKFAEQIEDYFSDVGGVDVDSSEDEES